MSDPPDDAESDATDRWEPRPTPDVTPETTRYWEGAATDELRLGHCPDCGLTFFYPRARCPDCLSPAETTVADGTGTIYSYSVTERVDGWPDDQLPLIVAYVELTEGPRIVTNVVDCEPADVDIGRDATVAFVPTDEDGVSVPVFRLAEGA
ncbi:Zn-ribbon domain-containing OB-fold protein [Halovivax limisalsi]|uniref:Zn-ribbon domain-containing OB-fold protein n=1 Tax=Halovivax limisalsi TaxID=1453760 RepID=UPI001FFD6520|nr:OB-fold domain-containing protein [Halovivax limisalsi]